MLIYFHYCLLLIYNFSFDFSFTGEIHGSINISKDKNIWYSWRGSGGMLCLPCSSQAWLLHSTWDLCSSIRDQTHVPCTGRQILYHCTTREAPKCSLFVFSFTEVFIASLTVGKFSCLKWVFCPRGLLCPGRAACSLSGHHPELTLSCSSETGVPRSGRIGSGIPASLEKGVVLETFNQDAVQSLSCVWLFATPWTAARQASLSFTNSRSLLKLMSIESVMPNNFLVLCGPLLLLPSSSVTRFSSRLQSFPASGSFLMSWLFASGGQSTGASASASVLPMPPILPMLQHQSFWSGWAS